MRKFLVILLLTGSSMASAGDMKTIPAQWHHELSSTSLVDYKKGEHLVISSIYTGVRTQDAVVRHSLEVKVTSWGKPFTQSFESKDKRSNETLTVTLYETDNPKEMKADFEHVVSENGIVVLRFCGTTVLTRVN